MSSAAFADGSSRYRIGGEIARGGMGTVLNRRDPDLRRDVARKILCDDYRDNTIVVRRFVEEAQIGGQVEHPGLVSIYELGTLTDRRPFIAMKLVKGHTSDFQPSSFRIVRDVVRHQMLLKTSGATQPCVTTR
jgi:serine/threonine protein kinase